MPGDVRARVLPAERLANLRMAFNLKERVNNIRDYKLPGRALGRPPIEEGPLKGVAVDNKAPVRYYLAAMGWNPNTGVPKRDVFERLGL